MKSYELRRASDVDYEFLRQLHHATMRDYVDPIWGWDEAVQDAHFRRHFDPSDTQVVMLDGQDIGALTVNHRPTELFLANIQLLPEYQRRGIGTTLVRTILDDADRAGLSVLLTVLRNNPARTLYQRLGFTIREESEKHFVMRRDGMAEEAANQ